MIRSLIYSLALAALLFLPAQATAHHHRHVRHFLAQGELRHAQNYQPWAWSRSLTGNNSRPARWCGWQMRQWFGGGPKLNLAANWAHVGAPASPAIGVVVVWPHHVGYISGETSDGRWLVKSGNDGGAVRERARSLAGVIAFRRL